MASWYCMVGGSRYGPVDDAYLVQWIREGRLLPTDLVWREGMAQWAPAVQTPELAGHFAPAAAGPGMPPPLPSTGMVDRSPAGGTGGRTPNATLTAQARGLLSGRWGLPIGFSFLLALILMAINVVPMVGGLAALAIGGPMTLGGVIFYLTFTRGGSPQLEMLFAGFRNFGNALGVYILASIFVFLWALLLIIPGIIAALAYSQAFYLLADSKNLGPLEAITRSKEMMRGHKWRLFCLHMRFFGWSLLCLLTLGIGYLWLMPYIATSLARFYDDLRPPAGAAAVVPAAAPEPGH